MKKIGFILMVLVLLGMLAASALAEQNANGEALPVLRRDTLTQEQIDSETGTVLGSEIERSAVRRITVLDSLDGKPADAWDVSAAGDGTVWAWTVASDTEGMYDLYIAGQGGVAAPENAAYLFCGYTNAVEICLGEAFDTSGVTDMNYMFQSCVELTSLDLTGFDTSNVTSMYAMFQKCSVLTSLDVSSFDTSNVTNMGYMFGRCGNLVHLDVTGFNTVSVTNMCYMFDECVALASLDVSGFDTSNVTDMSCMFFGCSALASLDLTGFDTSNVTSMYAMFQECVALASLDVTGFDTSNVTNMGHMFFGCSALTSLDLTSFNTANVADMLNMFYGCSKLESISVSEAFRICENAEGMLDGCPARLPD